MKRGYIISFLLGFLLVSIVSVYAVSTSDIIYKDTTVDEEIEELYSKMYLKGSLSAVNNTGTLTLTNNTKQTMYVAVFAYVSASGAPFQNKTSIASVTGADYTEVFYAANTNSHYAIRIYRLSNCEENVTVKANSTSGYGNMILFD